MLILIAVTKCPLKLCRQCIIELVSPSLLQSSVLANFLALVVSLVKTGSHVNGHLFSLSKIEHLFIHLFFSPLYIKCLFFSHLPLRLLDFFLLLFILKPIYIFMKYLYIKEISPLPLSFFYSQFVAYLLTLFFAGRNLFLQCFT